MSSNINAETETQNFPYSAQKEFPLIKNSKTFLVCKRLIDIIGALIGLLISLPILIIISLFYINGDAKGPVFLNR